MPLDRAMDPAVHHRQNRAPKTARLRPAFALLSSGAMVLAALTACSSMAIGSDAPPAFVIRVGGTYTGHWESPDPDAPVILIQTSEPVVIENSTIVGRGHLIATEHGRDAHVTVRNVRGTSLPPVAGRFPGRFLSADTFAYVSVENSSMIGTSGIYLRASNPGATVRVLRNRALNIDGRISDGQGGYRRTAIVQFLQIDGAVDLIDTEIAWNHVVNEPFRSGVEDVINFYRTSGTDSDPILVHNNLIQGAYAPDPTTGPYSGGGIMLGDAGGGFVHAYENHVVGTSNYGIAISGGQNNRIYDNRVVSCGFLADGTTAIVAQNVGIYIWNHYDQLGFRDNVGFGNAIGWAHPEQVRNDYWVPDAARWESTVELVGSARVPCSAEAEESARWQSKVVDAGHVIGWMAP